MNNSEVENDKKNLSEDFKKIESNESHDQSKKDDSDEDIPGDFFDDFLKEDFMAGLDIVDDDEWDEEKIKLDIKTLEKTKKNVDVPVGGTKLVDGKKKRKKMEGESNKSPIEEKIRSKQKKKKYEEREDNHKHKRNIGKQIDADEFDIRRDPEKTKRDIARDKVRCEKDKELKMISEKLSLVETGLVPPGMEMEIDMEEVKRQQEMIENKSPRDLREHLKDLKGRNKSPSQRGRSPLKKRGELEESPFKRRELERKSPVATKRLSSPRRRSRSPRRNSLALRTAISPRRSPYRRMSPRRNPHRNLSPRLRSPERVVHGRRRSRSVSPFYRNRRDKYSPHRHRNRSGSRESAREKWLKRRHHSRSPRRKRDEKKSFLQEIAEKLNEIRHPINVMPQLQPMQPMQPMLQPMQPTLRYVQPQTMPVPVPAPAPVPPPQNGPLFLEPPQQQFDPYDQSFFIGHSQPAVPNNFSCQAQPTSLSIGSQMPLNPSILPTNLAPNLINTSDNPMKVEPSRQVPKTQEDVGKLFQDKQISLSEFLAITAKPEVLSASPIHLQEKIKVITRCHDAIKILTSSEKKYSGKLTVHKTNTYKASGSKDSSPLKSAPPVVFPFTNPSLPAEEQKHNFTKFINELLHKLGLLKETVFDVDDEEPSNTDVKTKNIINVSPPPPPVIKLFNSHASEIKQVRYSNFQDNRLSKMVQTDVFKCESCEKRKKILYRTMALQTNDPSPTFSVSTQVTEEDFQMKIPKTQSLAALTPAQLLAKSRESLNAATRGGRIDVDNFDIQATGYNNRSVYGLPRSNLPPFSNPSMSIYDTLNSQMSAGGGRGRDTFGPRMKEPNVRFSYNNYY